MTTQIKIATPLPMGVASALIQLIGTAWPDANALTDGGWNDNHLIIEVDDSKPAKRITKREAAKLRKEAERDAEYDPDFLGFDGNTLRMAPPEDLCRAVGAVGLQILEAFDSPENYVEWGISSPEGESGILCIARSKEQTPHALRLKADARVAELEALLSSHGIEVPA